MVEEKLKRVQVIEIGKVNSSHEFLIFTNNPCFEIRVRGKETKESMFLMNRITEIMFVIEYECSSYVISLIYNLLSHISLILILSTSYSK
jgi:hypothetical protein